MADAPALQTRSTRIPLSEVKQNIKGQPISVASGNDKAEEVLPLNNYRSPAKEYTELTAMAVKRNQTELVQSSADLNQGSKLSSISLEEEQLPSAAARRCRRRRLETSMPLKKRLRRTPVSVSSEDGGEEVDPGYTLPSHVERQMSADRAPAADEVGRSLRPRKAADLVAMMQDFAEDQELSADGDEEELVIAEKPRRHRGRPRKSSTPKKRVRQRSLSLEDEPSETHVEQEDVSVHQPEPEPEAESDTHQHEEQMQQQLIPATPVSVLSAGRRYVTSCSGLQQPVSLTADGFLHNVPARKLPPCLQCRSLSVHSEERQQRRSGDTDGALHEHVTTRCLIAASFLQLQVATADGERRPVNFSRSDEHLTVVSLASTRVQRKRAPYYRRLASPSRDETFPCPTCGKRMNSLSRLNKHQLVHSNARPYQCDMCLKSFKSIHVLNSHALTHSNYRPFKCHICQQTFAKKWTLLGHMKIHDKHGVIDFTCSTCSCVCEDRSTYESHLKIHTGERKWECRVCHRGFSKKLKLRKHMVVHSKSMLHKCEICLREFRWKEKLIKHIMLHTGERPFQCTAEGCVKAFRAHSDLNVHLRNVHKIQPKKIDYPIVKSDPKPNHCELLLMRVNEVSGVPSCDLCTRRFVTKDEYLDHVIPAHREQDAYVCHPCKQVFPDRAVYEEHQDHRHRRGEILWRCHLCPKVYSKQSFYEGHRRLHRTQYQCKVCFRFSDDKRRLELHILSHTHLDIDNDDHSCTICDRQFKLRFSLKNHMFKVHSIDLPSLRKPPMRKFECSVCQARFIRPAPAFSHMVKMHGIRPDGTIQEMCDAANLSGAEAVAAVLDAASAGADGVIGGEVQQVSPEDAARDASAKMEAMAAQGMWDASVADGSTYLGGRAARRRKMAAAAAKRNKPDLLSAAMEAVQDGDLVETDPSNELDHRELQSLLAELQPMMGTRDPIAVTSADAGLEDSIRMPPPPPPPPHTSAGDFNPLMAQQLLAVEVVKLEEGPQLERMDLTPPATPGDFSLGQQLGVAAVMDGLNAVLIDPVGNAVTSAMGDYQQ